MAEKQSTAAADRNIPALAVLILAGVAVVLALTNTFLAYRNTQCNAEVRERAQMINQGAQLSPLNQQLSQLIGGLALQSGDIDLRAVLERYGVTVTAQPAPPADTGADAPRQP